jgi:hypothetical protein
MQQDVLAAQDVTFTDPAAFEGQEVTFRDVVDMREIQPGVDEGRDSARRVERMRPVGVGRMSRGPSGVVGLTMMAGSLSRRIIPSTARSAGVLLRCVPMARPVRGRRFIDRTVCARRASEATARMDDPLHARSNASRIRLQVPSTFRA